MSNEDRIGTPQNRPTIPEWTLPPTPANNKIYAWAGNEVGGIVKSWADSIAKREGTKRQQNASFLTTRGRTQSAEESCWEQIEGWLQDGTIESIDLTPVVIIRPEAAQPAGGSSARTTNGERITTETNDETKRGETRNVTDPATSTPRKLNDEKRAEAQDATGGQGRANTETDSDGRGTDGKATGPTTPQRPRTNTHMANKGKGKAKNRSDETDSEDGGAASRRLFDGDGTTSDDGGATTPDQRDMSPMSSGGGRGRKQPRIIERRNGGKHRTRRQNYYHCYLPSESKHLRRDHCGGSHEDARWIRSDFRDARYADKDGTATSSAFDKRCSGIYETMVT